MKKVIAITFILLIGLMIFGCTSVNMEPSSNQQQNQQNSQPKQNQQQAENDEIPAPPALPEE